MDTGFQGYMEYVYSSPSTALSMAQKHLTALRTKVDAAMTDGPSSYDSRALEGEINRTREDIRQIAQMTGVHGRVRMAPCVTADSNGVGPYAAPGLIR